MALPHQALLYGRFAAVCPQLLRIVVAGMVGWQVCELFHPPSPPVFAAVVPLVAMRDQPYSAFNLAFDRLAGVICGVVLGIVVVGMLGPSLTSVALVLAVGLVAGTAVKLGSGINIQVSASALLVFVNPDPGVYAWSRLWETLVGALVTTGLSPFLFPPDAARDYRTALTETGKTLAGYLGETAGLVGPGKPDRVALQRLLDSTQQTDERARGLPAELLTAQRAVRFNPLRRRDRAPLGALTDVTESTTILARGVRQLVEDITDQSDREDLVGLWTNNGPQLANVLRPLADAVDAMTRDPQTRVRPPTLAQARAELTTWSAADRSALAGVIRRPAAKVLAMVEKADEGRVQLAQVGSGSTSP